MYEIGWMCQLYSLVVIMQKKKKKISEKVFLRVFHRMDILFLTIYPFRG